jgi:hypothetical protein
MPAVRLPVFGPSMFTITRLLPNAYFLIRTNTRRFFSAYEPALPAKV